VSRWTTRDIPDQTGRRVVVTGATSGLGFHTALELARHGAAVVLGVRDVDRGREAAERIRAEARGADVAPSRLDLADLSSVREFAGDVGRDRVDVLVNNAGVMALPPRRSVDGFELQLATNHLGPFALTGLLLPALLRRPGSRVVAVSSYLHRNGRIDLDDLMSDRSYGPWPAYSQSKLANLLFMRELDRRARDAGVGLVSVAAHPGWATTNLQLAAPRMTGRRLTAVAAHGLNALVGQSAASGAWSQLRAATDPEAAGGDYFGPRGPGGLRGAPVRVGMSTRARDDVMAARLWEESVRLTDVDYRVLSTSGAPGS
jgi:NAD(P)-dependent dehydrogenase (short-subunit alcohol dehydrogenase family)